MSHNKMASFQTEPAKDIEEKIKAFVTSSPLNRMPSSREYIIFDEPLIRFADGDDTLYNDYKTIISPSHLTPREAFAQGLGKNINDLPVQLAIISWVLPITEKTRRSNRREKEVPSRLWSHTRWYGEQFNNILRRHVEQIINEMGYLAVAPILQPYFREMANREVGLFSTWSERHTAYVAGHGTFSLSDGFITEHGIAHRCGSVITDLPIIPSKRNVNNHYSNCLFYVDGSCKACIKRCPAGAITEKGHDKIKCMNWLRYIGYLPLSVEYKDKTSVAGCGLCQVKVPCEYRIPSKIEKLGRVN